MTKYLFLLCLAGSARGDTVFQLDPSKTEIKFSLHATMHTVHGTFQLKRGTIRFDPAGGKASGEIVIDTTSAKTGIDMRDKAMHTEILESQKYPEAVFVPDSVSGRLETEGESLVDVRGRLKIHGDEHELTLQFIVDAQGGAQYKVSTHFNIPYLKWGLKNPGNFFLRVDDKVEMEVKASAAAR